MRLTDAQREAVRAGSRNFRGTRETGVMGSTMQALHRKGLADVIETRRPYKRLVYRLNTVGRAQQRRLRADELVVELEEATGVNIDELDGPLMRQQAARGRLTEEALLEMYPPAPSAGVRCRCTHCGAVFDDATPGGSCGQCGLEVIAV